MLQVSYRVTAAGCLSCAATQRFLATSTTSSAGATVKACLMGQQQRECLSGMSLCSTTGKIVHHFFRFFLCFCPVAAITGMLLGRQWKSMAHLCLQLIALARVVWGQLIAGS